jgi:4-hydroxy-2-oxoheptanedioate aldolase
MFNNVVKTKMMNGERVWGCFLKTPDSTLTEMLALQGFDFLVLDAEHGPMSPKACEDMVRSCELHGVVPLVRVPDLGRSTILRYMDTGAYGIHAPCVQTAEEARRVVDAIKYHPYGNRGLGGVRAGEFMFNHSYKDYCEHANEQTMVVVQVETATAIDQLPAIAAVEGVDAIFIGPTDLSHSLGVPGELTHPSVQDALQRITAQCLTANKCLAIMIGNADAANAWQERGARYFAVTFESMIKSGCRQYLDTIKR